MIGYGATRDEAISDLQRLLQERAEAHEDERMRDEAREDDRC